jgi:transposase
MLHAGLDLSRHRLDVHVLSEDGSTLQVSTAPPDRDGLRSLVRQVATDCGQEEVWAVIESMNGARFVHDTLELCGWSVEIADPRKVKGLAPLALQNGPHRRLGARGAVLARPRPGHLAARSSGAL